MRHARTTVVVLVGVVMAAGCGANSSPRATATSSGPVTTASGQAAPGATTVTIGVGTYSAMLTTDAFAQQGLALEQQQVNSSVMPRYKTISAPVDLDKAPFVP